MATQKQLPVLGPSLRLGVDTGGTFTDFVAQWTENAVTQQWAFKLPSTPHAPETAILQGLTQTLQQAVLLASTHRPIHLEIVHGTTVATNLLLERKGAARTALVTTAGFEDVLEIGRQARPEPYNLSVRRPAPLVAADLCFGVAERVTATGEILTPLSAASLTQLVHQLRCAQVESIAVVLLFSFVNPTHEQTIAAALQTLGVPVSLSCKILPEYREYERSSTLVINAYLAPRVGEYVARLITGLQALCVQSSTVAEPRLRIMQSSGGSISANLAAREPVRTILSGPAGGVVAATRVAALAGWTKILTFDMGGTSTDVALCDGAPSLTNEAQIAGLPVAVPILDIHTVGAGGGSLAFVDDGGALRVGPASAGADPGPACYGKGTQATVTDANCVLGRFAGAGLLAGALPLDVTRARTALQELATAMQAASGKRVSVAQAALGVIQLANANMEQALRLVSLERGHDPRAFTLVGFGGAGGLHVAALAEALRIPRVLIPKHPGAFSALGVLLADVVKDYARTVMLRFAPTADLPKSVTAIFAQLETEARRALRGEGFAPAEMLFARRCAMRYLGQSFELEIDWPSTVPSTSALSTTKFAQQLRDAFHAAHQQRYGHSDTTRELEIVSLRLRATGITAKPALEATARVRCHAAAPLRLARVWLGLQAQTIPVYDREQLHPGAWLNGAAIVTEYGCTTLVPTGWRATVDRWENLLLEAA